MRSAKEAAQCDQWRGCCRGGVAQRVAAAAQMLVDGASDARAGASTRCFSLTHPFCPYVTPHVSYVSPAFSFVQCASARLDCIWARASKRCSGERCRPPRTQRRDPLPRTDASRSSTARRFFCQSSLHSTGSNSRCHQSRGCCRRWRSSRHLLAEVSSRSKLTQPLRRQPDGSRGHQASAWAPQQREYCCSPGGSYRHEH